MIPGDGILYVRRHEILVISARAGLPYCIGEDEFNNNCECSDDPNESGWPEEEGVTNSAVLDMQWTHVGFPNDPALASATNLITTSVLVVSRAAMKNLVIGANYTLQIEAGVWTGFVQNSVRRYSTMAQIKIVPIPVPPVPRVRNGNRVFGPKDQVRISAADSWDPDWRTGDRNFIYTWFLDCEGMYDLLPQHEKDSYAVNRRTWLAACYSTSLVQNMMYQANIQYSPAFDTAVLRDSPLSPISLSNADFPFFVASPEAFKYPFDLLIGVTVRD
eukprot:244698-Rhodomonas_salina.1